MCFFLSLHLSGVRRECVGVYWCAMLSATVSFSPLPLGAAKVRNVQIQQMGSLICCNCSIHCVSDKQMAIYPVRLCSFTNLGKKKKQHKAVNQLLCKWHLISFPPFNPWGHGLRNPIKFEGPVENREWRTQREGDRERLYSVYSREQKIKVQEGGDRRAEQWAGSVLRGSFMKGRGQSWSAAETHFVYVALCGKHWHSSSSWHRYTKALAQIILLRHQGWFPEFK